MFIVIALCLVHLSLPVLAQAPNSEVPEIRSLILIQENSLVGQTSPENPPKTLVNGFRDLIYDKEVADVLSKIITCESGGNCKAQNPNSSAYGLCQMLTSTREGLEKKWGFKIDKKNCEEQYYACYRLLKEEGRKHWLETEWCWSK
jgi:hypothetical protein